MADDENLVAAKPVLLIDRIDGGLVVEGGTHVLVKLNDSHRLEGLLFAREVVGQLIDVLQEQLAVAERLAAESEAQSPPNKPIVN